mmetsp:Transcript_2003/g.2820  ORF Transcript_2003/g.2820 Transcript_2003/m.2820 type:complete len:85 (-) Transcript_2003:263-517(-)
MHTAVNYYFFHVLCPARTPNTRKVKKQVDRNSKVGSLLELLLVAPHRMESMLGNLQLLLLVLLEVGGKKLFVMDNLDTEEELFL